MSEVKRYLAKISWAQIETQEHPNGEFVLHSDYALLKAEVERLEKDVWRMKVVKGIDEDSIQTLLAALKTVPDWAKVLEAIENNARLEAENNTLKAEVNHLRDCLGDAHAHNIKEEVKIEMCIEVLQAEVERLTAFTTRTIIPNEELQAQVERLTKAIMDSVEMRQRLREIEGKQP